MLQRRIGVILPVTELNAALVLNTTFRSAFFMRMAKSEHSFY